MLKPISYICQASFDGDWQSPVVPLDGVWEAEHHHHRVGDREGEEASRQEEVERQKKQKQKGLFFKT